jgi:hypothetical protein
MSGDVLAWYLKECLLGARKTPTCVGNLPKKLVNGDKIQPLSFQKVGPKSGQPGVIGFGYFIVPYGTKKC